MPPDTSQWRSGSSFGLLDFRALLLLLSVGTTPVFAVSTERHLVGILRCQKTRLQHLFYPGRFSFCEPAFESVGPTLQGLPRCHNQERERSGTESKKGVPAVRSVPGLCGFSLLCQLVSFAACTPLAQPAPLREGTFVFFV